MSSLQFNRPELALEMAESVLGKKRFGDSSGLLLANRRRTGKTTFLLIDLIPALQNLGAITVYVDLWANKDIPPGVLIAGAIGDEIARHKPALSKVGRISKVKVYGVEIEIAGAPAGRQATLYDLLAELHRRTGRQVALLVDEAQHAVLSEQGMNVMAALKSARDQMNTPGDLSLALVMTGSDRDKLCRLVNSNKAPFAGATIQTMSLLGREYIAFLAQGIEQDRPEIKVDVDRMFAAFQRLGQRPEPMVTILKDLTGLGRPPAERFHEEMDARVQAHVETLQARYLDAYLSLPPAQQAVLEWVLSDRQDSSGPFEARSKDHYAKFLGRKLSTPQIQNAIEAMRNREPPILWKSERAEYALDDAGFRAWYEELKSAGQWPPTQ